MSSFRSRDVVVALLSLAWPISSCSHTNRPMTTPRAERASALDSTVSQVCGTLVKKHGAQEAARIERGVAQVARLWREDDGDAATFAAFCENEFMPRGAALDALFGHLEYAMERIEGYLTSLQRDLRSFADLEQGPLQPIDERLAALNLSAHSTEDLFVSKVAFIALLNFPAANLSERLEKGEKWTRREWAEAKLAGRFATRQPASVQQAIAKAAADAEAYIASYNIHMHHVLTDDGRRLFPNGLRLITHWGLRDELKACYAESGGLEKQKLIERVMERIVRQEIPKVVINDPSFDWQPSTNAVVMTAVPEAPRQGAEKRAASTEREPDERYARWLETFRANRLADAYDPECPTHVARRFERDRQIPEAGVRALFEAVLDIPMGLRVGKLIERRLGRPLEPFDIWYAGFKPRGRYTEAELDDITRKRYPNAQAYAADIPRLLTDLGFVPEKARFVADHIVVEPSRGAGHAFGAQRRDDKAHLRTRVGANGMDYKGYNIAVHEMGHNVEQVFSMTTIDHTLLNGVPNTAFTEALAFVFQCRDLELLGLDKPDADSEHLRALEDYWATREIAGVALVDMAVWRWLYEHPEATAAEMRAAVVSIAQETWNRWYAPIFGRRDVSLLAIYSHMVDGAMYTPDYPLGHLIAFQVDQYFRKQPKLGAEFERVAQLGALTPDLWMRKACGAPLSAQPLIDAAKAALDAFEKK